MFVKKTAAQVAAMIDAERDQYSQDKSAHEAAQLKAINDKIDETIKTLKDEIKTASDKGVTKEEMATLKTQFDELKEVADQIKESNTNKNVGDALKNELRVTFKDSMSSVGSGERLAMKEFVVKATALRASVSGNPYFLDAGGIGQLAYRKLVVYDLFPKVTVPKNLNGTVKYVDWDSATISRAAAAQAEGAVFAESTAAWVTNSLTLQKVGDSIPMSEEFLYDDEMFANELENFLRTNVAIKIDTDLISANGTAPNMKGLLAQVPAYTAVAAGIPAASIYDLLVKVRSAITKPYGSKYDPNFALMNTDDIDAMMLTKDANDNYVMPPFVDKNGNTVKGLLIIECNSITANQMIVGDSRYAKIYEEAGVYVGVGYDQDDWSKDLMTMKARKRMNLLVRVVDQTGFLKVASISASLTTLAS